MTDRKDSFRLDDMLGAQGSEALARHIADAGCKDAALGKFGASPDLLRGAVVAAVKPQLNFDVLAFLADGWRTASEIRACRNPDPSHPGAVTVLKLGSHSITRELRPVINVRLGTDIRCPLDIAIALTATFEGIEISIADACIQAVGAGTCSLSVEIKLASEAVHDPTTLGQWKLPGEHRFDPALPIP